MHRVEGPSNIFVYREKESSTLDLPFYKGVEVTTLSLKDRFITWLNDLCNWLQDLFLTCLGKKGEEADTIMVPSRAPDNENPPVNRSDSPEPPASGKLNDCPESPLSPVKTSPIKPEILKDPDPTPHTPLLISEKRIKPLQDLKNIYPGDVVAVKEDSFYKSYKVVEVLASGSVWLSNGESVFKAFISNIYSISYASTITLQSSEIDMKGFKKSDFKEGEEVARGYEKGRIIKFLNPSLHSEHADVLIDDGVEIHKCSTKDLYKLRSKCPDNTNIVLGSLINNDQIEGFLRFNELKFGQIVAVPMLPNFRAVTIHNSKNSEIIYQIGDKEFSAPFFSIRKVKGEVSAKVKLAEEISFDRIIQNDPKPFKKDEIIAYQNQLQIITVQYKGENQIDDGFEIKTVDEKHLFRFKESRYHIGQQLSDAQVISDYESVNPGDFVAYKSERKGFITYTVVKLASKRSEWHCEIFEDPNSELKTGTVPEYIYAIKPDYVALKATLNKDQLGHIIEGQYLLFGDVLRRDEIAVGDFIAFIQKYTFRTAQILNINDETVSLDIGSIKPLEIPLKLLLKINPSKALYTISYKNYALGDTVDPDDLHENPFTELRYGDLASLRGKIIRIHSYNVRDVEYLNEKGRFAEIGNSQMVKPLKSKFNNREPREKYATGTYITFQNATWQVIANLYSELIIMDGEYNRRKISILSVQPY